MLADVVALYRQYLAGEPPVPGEGSSAAADTEPRLSHVQEEVETMKGSPAFKELSATLQERVLALPAQVLEPPAPAPRREGKHEKDGMGGE